MRKHRIQRAIRNYARSFGLLKPRRKWTRTMALIMTVLVIVTGVIWAGRAVIHWVVVDKGNSERRSAIALAEQQVRWLGENLGLAPGQECFDTSGVARNASEPGDQCSYFPDGKRNGCLASNTARCYSVHVTTVSKAYVREQDTELVSYVVYVDWRGAAGAQQMTLGYQLARASGVSGGDSGGSVTSDVQTELTVPQTQRISTMTQPQQIRTLADIPGGATVSVSGTACSATAICPVAGAYGLRASFGLTTNIPEALITGCTWDFGDGSAAQTVTADQGGCLSGQTVIHDYSHTWQMQSLPTYPLACHIPIGQGLDTHAFNVRVTLHTQENRDVSAASPYRLILPLC